MTTDWPQPGDVVCDCLFQHLTVISRNGDAVILEDGTRCFIRYCLDRPDHADPHPDWRKSP